MRSGRAVALACLATFGIIVALAAAPAGALGITATKRAVATGHGGAVASDTLQATRAGLKILNDGGTAADAAVAVASTLGVTDPFVAGIGGGGYFVYYDARTAPRLHDRRPRDGAGRRYLQTCSSTPRPGKPLPFPTAVTSGLSVGVPGTLMTWQRALDRWGRFTLARRPAARASAWPSTASRVDRDAARAGARERLPVRPVQLDQRAVPARRSAARGRVDHAQPGPRRAPTG